MVMLIMLVNLQMCHNAHGLLVFVFHLIPPKKSDVWPTSEELMFRSSVSKRHNHIVNVDNISLRRLN